MNRAFRSAAALRDDRGHDVGARRNEPVDNLKWEDEPDLDELRKLVAQLASHSPDAIRGLEVLGERGSVASAAYLAEFYMSNNERPDNSRAIYWYSKAHEKGYAPASYMLGRLYSR